MAKKRAALPRALPRGLAASFFLNNKNLKLSGLSQGSKLSNTWGQTPAQHDSGTRCLDKVLKKEKR